MAASDKVPLTVTWTPTTGVTSTVTVLGQVLNNGETNWVASGSHAIVLETSSAAGGPSTVLEGQTYYLTTGPALPDQATGVKITPSETPSGAASMSSMPASNSGGAMSGSTSFHLTTPSMSSSAAPSSSSGSGGSNAAGKQVDLTGSMGLIVAGLLFSCVLGVVAL